MSDRRKVNSGFGDRSGSWVEIAEGGGEMGSVSEALIFSFFFSRSFKGILRDTPSCVESTKSGKEARVGVINVEFLGCTASNRVSKFV